MVLRTASVFTSNLSPASVSFSMVFGQGCVLRGGSQHPVHHRSMDTRKQLGESEYESGPRRWARKELNVLRDSNVGEI